ncbi:hypothetical protein PAECIP111891_02444 [Paenibacillus allorhizoplanae]|uniref:Knr4/Smi1-like domain-containing protein n=1 Tax=Paenibacillus allorhizoplanae TaxID=2905648 RepID=A0ABM9C6Y4_9BACL|nr:SMI1/KNR4 family protein [Paenibacillus allorhizoplanae]CAH1203841.1 hypothetical protein PAECIP111891_02444 [Paenibacillus allorhizoplanae]
MSNEIIFEAQSLVERIKTKYPKFVGQIASKADIIELERKLKTKLPEWFYELYTTVPIIDAEFGVQENEPDDDYDGISYMMWGDVNSIIQECTEYEPGISVLQDGYIYIATCSHGSGDPIFINLNTEEPKVFRIYHDDFRNVLLAGSLVDLFKNAII